METHRPNTEEESFGRRQFLKKLALGAGAVGIAGATGFNIIMAEKAQRHVWRREILKRQIECSKLGFIREQNKISKKAQDWVPEEVEYYNKFKRNALIAGATTEVGIAYLAFNEKIVNKVADILKRKRQPSPIPPQE